MENRKQEPPQSQTKKIRDVTQLHTWQAARKLRAELYRLTGPFPREEKLGLAAQTRRAAVSVTANLAEGYGRFSYQENIQYCRQSRASTYPVRDHLTTALDQAYLSQPRWEELDDLARPVIPVLNGYIRATQKLGEKREV